MFNNLMRRFVRDEKGTIAMIFGMMFIVVLAMVGSAIDYGRYVSARGQTANALDAAVLAGARVMQVDKNEAGALAAAKTYYELNKSKWLSGETVRFSFKDDGKIVYALTEGAVPTPFMGLLGVKELRLDVDAEAVAEANGLDIEIAMMLDNTGSMSGRKMRDLKDAALDLVETVVSDNQSEFKSRVAIVPFAEQVRLDSYAFSIATGKTVKGGSTSKNCVRERTGTNRYTDLPPNDTNGRFVAYPGKNDCRPNALLLPLTSDKQALRVGINAMPATGSTAGHIGTAWAWYALSPEFADLWPLESKPEPYAKLSELNENNQPKLVKIAILMTDGAYNTQYSGTYSSTQAKSLCTAMKAKKIQVYTVGFGISKNSSADKVLQFCSTGNDFHYNAADGDELKAAFRSIAYKISKIRLQL